MRVNYLLAAVFMGCLALLLGPGRGLSQRGGPPDPNRIFDFMSRGQPTINISEMRFGAEDVMAWARKQGITNGKLTREQYIAYSQSPEAAQARERMMSRFGSRRGGSDSGSPSAAPTTGTPSPGTPSPGTPAPGTPAPGTPAPSSGDSRGFDRSRWDRDRGGSSDWVQRMMDERFRDRDKNGDGFLNYDELSESLKGEREKWDTNKDGQVDLNEWREYAKAYFDQRREEGGSWSRYSGDSREGPSEIPVPEQPKVDLNKKMTVYRASNLPSNLPKWFAECDLDKDAQVALYEWKDKNGTVDEFQKLDLNTDGFITVDEVLRSTTYASKDKNTGPGTTVPGAPGSGTPGSGTPGYTLPTAGGPSSSGDRRTMFSRGPGGFPGGMPESGPGGFSRSGTGGSSRGGSGWDANSFFDRYANGKPTIVIDQVSDGRSRGRLEDWARKNNVTNGQITREQFASYLQERMSGGRGSRGSDDDSSGRSRFGRRGR